MTSVHCEESATYDVLMFPAELLTGELKKEENPKELLFSVLGDLSYISDLL